MAPFGVVVFIECNQLLIGVFVLVRIESLCWFSEKKRETRESRPKREGEGVRTEERDERDKRERRERERE